jgi:DNA-binding CsgD family transcriptional regulator
MQLTAQDETDLLTALHDGPFEQPLWSSFLDRLRARTRSRYASLIFRPLDATPDGLIELHSGERSPPHIQRLYLEELYKRDPLPYHRYRDGRVYTTDELLSTDDPVHRAFLDELLVPSGMARMRTMRVTEESGISAWLSVARDDPDYRAGDGALLAALAPHLRRALRSFVAIERARFKADTASTAMRRLNFGWVALDAQGRIVDRDAQAQRLLERSPALRPSRQGRLGLADPQLDRQLGTIVRAFATDPGTRPRALTVSREPWIDMLIVPAQGHLLSAQTRPVAIAYLHADSLSTADRHEQIAELFGLLPSEARLALALSRGQTLAEAAGTLGLTIETARNYSKKIYAKMGARGQSDLIRFILASTLALA